MTVALHDFDTYLRYELNRSAYTVDSYLSDIHFFAEYITGGKSEEFEPQSVTIRDVRAWISSLAAGGMKVSSLRRKTAALRCLFRFMMRRKEIDRDPTADIILARLPRPLPKFIREEEMENLMSSEETLVNEAAESNKVSEKEYFIRLRDLTILEVFYTTGIRQAELLGIRDSDVSPTRRELRVLGKRAKERIVPLAAHTLGLITELRNLRDSLFPSQERNRQLFLSNRGNPLNKRVLYSIIKEKLNSTTADRKSPHVLRHTFATSMLNHGAGLLEVKEFLGHSKLDSTQIYTHVSFQELKNNYEQAHPRAIKRNTMETNIRAIHFDITEKLTSFINKKIEKLCRRYDAISGVDVCLTVVKPETSNNKEAAVKLTVPNNELFASKIADTFEEAIDLCLDALEKPLEKNKGKK